MAAQKSTFFSSLIQRCPKWSSLQPSELLYFRRTLTNIPFSSETPPPLVWERSAPSQWGSFQCGTGSSCRGWCVHGHGKYAYASLGPCSPGCAQSPESPHPNPTRSQCGMKWNQHPNSGKAAFMQAKLQSVTVNYKLNTQLKMY